MLILLNDFDFLTLRTTVRILSLLFGLARSSQVPHHPVEYSISCLFFGSLRGLFIKKTSVKWILHSRITPSSSLKKFFKIDTSLKDL